jgi:hypothetical protein
MYFKYVSAVEAVVRLRKARHSLASILALSFSLRKVFASRQKHFYRQTA